MSAHGPLAAYSKERSKTGVKYVMTIGLLLLLFSRAGLGLFILELVLGLRIFHGPCLESLMICLGQLWVIPPTTSSQS